MSQLAASTRDWVKSCAIDWILDVSVFFLLRLNLIHWLHGKYFNDILHFILYLSPLSTAVYSHLRARDKSLPSQLIRWNEGIHHADSRHCKAFTVIYMGEIDWFINREWIVLLLPGKHSVPLPNVAVFVQRTCLLYGGLYWACPMAAYRGSCVATSAHYLADAVTGLELGSSTLWQRTERSYFYMPSNIMGEALI